jgi:MYXO-CTERM domain-containing protein
MSTRGVHPSARLLVAVTFFTISGTANATPPGSSSADASSTHLRPPRHRDRFGRTLEDLCPERVPHQRRCYAERVVQDDAAAVDATTIRTDAPGFGWGDPSCTSMGGGGGQAPLQGSMTPNDVVAAYRLPSSAKAEGKIVALIELPSVHGLADVNAYRRQFGIPQLAACPVDGSGVPKPAGTACFARVGEDGTTGSVSTTDCPGWSGETGLDMDMVSAACPDCSIVLVEAASTSDLDQMNHIAATVVGASAASNSWGGPESGTDDATSYDNSGILTFAASGDSGYLNEGLGFQNGASFPASAPTVVAVGGTTLQKSGGNYSEVVWNDSARQMGFLGGGALGAGGSGCSGEFARPAWQSSMGFDFGSCAKRASVDLSAAAQFNPSSLGGGIAAYAADTSGWNAVEGTSAASPLVAAIMVRLGLAGKDNHDLFYNHIDAFNDVTSGSNDNQGLCNDVMCTAGKGWDGPTGLGTPNGERLWELVAPPPEAGSPSVDASVISAVDSGAGAPQSGAGSDASAELEASPSDDACSNCTDTGTGPSDDSNDAFPQRPPAGCACSSAPGSGEGNAGAVGAVAAGLGALVSRRRRVRA